MLNSVVSSAHVSISHYQKYHNTLCPFKFLRKGRLIFYGLGGGEGLVGYLGWGHAKKMASKGCPAQKK